MGITDLPWGRGVVVKIDQGLAHSKHPGMVAVSFHESSHLFIWHTDRTPNHRYELSTVCLPSMVLGAGDKRAGVPDKTPTFVQLSF